MDMHPAPHGATRRILGVYDASGRYLGPAPILIKWWPMDPRDQNIVRPQQQVAA